MIIPNIKQRFTRVRLAEKVELENYRDFFWGNADNLEYLTEISEFFSQLLLKD